VVPLNMRAHIAGPISRTMEDAVKVFQVIVGEDPRDPVTVPNYSNSLDRNSLKGAVIGVLHEAYERDSTDPEIVQIFMRALQDQRRAGATVVDPATVEGLEIKRRPRPSSITFWLTAVDRFLWQISLGFLKSGKFHPSTQKRSEDAEKGPENGPDSESCQADAAIVNSSGKAWRRR
jgi:Asp-tRNA(Asn)/Glu-tRNA(Gln) amidotransferase A subunit family amidase